MLRFQEDTARHLYRMQIIGPDGQPIETPEQMQAAQRMIAAQQQAQAQQQALAQQQLAQQQALAAHALSGADAPQMPPPRSASRQPQPRPEQGRLPIEGNGNAPAESGPQRVPAGARAPSTTIDRLEREFQQRKERELNQARAAGAPSSASNGGGPKRAGEKVGRNDKCPCGSGKKYKQCHGA